MDEIRKLESQYLSEVVKRLESNIKALEEECASARLELLWSRSSAYNENTHIIRTFDDVVDLSTAEQEAQKSSDSYNRTVMELKRAHIQMESPYFARIDFKDNEGTIPVYIGRFGLSRGNGMHPYVCDWRSPVASVFYDFDTGPAYYASPSGIIEGEIELKRQYKIANSIIELLFDCDVTVNDEILARALSEGGGEKLKVIVSSIQREQNKAIRHKSNGVMIVSGPAGSGKTSVGMHRLAWLLYHNRETLKSDDIVIISQNAVFSSYLSNVLPELGEDDIKRPVFDELVKPYVPQNYEFTDLFEQIKYVSGATTVDIRIKEIETKYSESFLRYIDEYFENYDFIVKDVVFRDEVICSADKLRELTLSEKGRYSFNIALDRILSYIRDKCDDYFKLHTRKLKRSITDESEESLLDKEVRYRAKNIERDFIQKTINSIYIANSILDEGELYAKLFKGFLNSCEVNNSAVMLRRLERRITKRSLLYEDLMLILRIKALAGRIEPLYSIKHVLIDEAQDYAIPQLMFLRHLYSKSSFTILTDPNQAVYPVISIPSLDMLRGFFTAAEEFHLENSYRCTRQIYDYARSFTSLPAMRGFARDGQVPGVISSENLVENIAAILRDGTVMSGTVGIITETVHAAKELCGRLGREFDITLVTSQDDKLKAGIIIIPALLVKGLEFDTAVIAGTFSVWDESLRPNLMYMLCTRALHRLYVTEKAANP